MKPVSHSRLLQKRHAKKLRQILNTEKLSTQGRNNSWKQKI